MAEQHTASAHKDWRGIVAAIAPTLGLALGGPLGGIAMQFVRQALVPGASAVSEVELAEILTGQRDGAGEALSRLRQADREFNLKIQELEIDLAQLHQEDRASARRRQIQLGDHWPNFLALLVLGGFFATVAFVLQHGADKLDGSRAAFVGTLVGYVSAKADQVVAYFFGSSSGSREKTRALTKAVWRSGDGRPMS